MNANAPYLDQLIQQQRNANVLEAHNWLGESANAHQTSHFGMENIVLLAQQEHSLTPSKTNAIIAHKDSSEILIRTVVIRSMNDFFIKSLSLR